jgi:hypothetical protein
MTRLPEMKIGHYECLFRFPEQAPFGREPALLAADLI